jgi:hypothetical protein
VAGFYVPAIGHDLPARRLVTTIPGRACLTGLIAAVVITAMFSLGACSLHAMVVSRLGQVPRHTGLPPCSAGQAAVPGHLPPEAYPASSDWPSPTASRAAAETRD